MKHAAWFLVVLVGLATLACSGAQFVSWLVTPTPFAALPPLPPTATASSAPVVPTIAVSGTPGAPTWWPAELAIPKTAQLTNNQNNQAVWNTHDTNVDGLRDFFLKEAKDAGYSAYTITLSQGSIYDLLLLKGTNAYDVNLTQGIDATVVTGTRIGTIHLEFSGIITKTLDLPLRERLNLTQGSEVAIGTSVPSPECGTCEYYFNVHIAPFTGPGGYNSQPAGTYIIDVEAIPGGTEDKDDYRWAKQCAVLIKDANSGNLSCAGLENVNDSSKLLNVTGSFQQPP